MKKNVTIENAQLREEMILGELFSGNMADLSFTGALIAVDPTVEEYASADPVFKEIVKTGRLEGVEKLSGSVIYFDTGANRAYIVPTQFVEITEVN